MRILIYGAGVIGRLWVGHSRFWIIPGTEEIHFVQTWPQVLKKRGILTLVWIWGAAVIALGIKSVFLILGALGIAGMWEAVFGDVGVTIIAVLNAMRILKK